MWVSATKEIRLSFMNFTLLSLSFGPLLDIWDFLCTSTPMTAVWSGPIQ